MYSLIYFLFWSLSIISCSPFCVAFVSYLNLDLDKALKLCEVETLVKEDNLSQHLVSIEDILKGYPKVNVVENADKLLYNGNKLNFKSVVPRNVKESVRVYDSKDNFVALYEYDNKYNEYKPIKMFL